MTSKILLNANIASMTANINAYGLIYNAALVINDSVIAWLGEQDQLPTKYAEFPIENLEGRLITPALIDCHTHLVYGGYRAREFELRLLGASYAEIARQGGGIISTVMATRKQTEAELLKAALPRVDALLAEGVCTVEIKSGYGLTIHDELKMLRVARNIEIARAI